MADLVIGDVFHNAARAAPHRIAAAHGDRSITFADLEQVSERLVVALSAHGLDHGDRVFVWTATALEVLPLVAALAKMGAVFTPLSLNVPADEAADLIRTARPRLLVVDGQHAVAAGFLDVPVLTLDNLLDLEGVARDRARVAESDPHLILFGASTRGRDKGVVISHRVTYLRTHPGAALEPRGPMVCVYPLSHLAAWTLSLQQWQARDTVVYVDPADGATIAAAVRGHLATRLTAGAEVWSRLLDHLGDDGRLPMLRFGDMGASSTSSTSPALLAAIGHACPNATLRVFYGSAETGTVASLEGDDVFTHPGSVGMPSIGSDVRLSADGEVRVRGPLLFSGYFGDLVTTDEVLVNGWYHTGDFGRVDSDGYLYITSRLGEQRTVDVDDTTDADSTQ